MRYVGFCAILLGALLLIRRQRLQGRRYIDFLDELARLYGHIEKRVSSYFESPSEWASSYSSEDEEIEAALGRIRGGVSPAAALGELARSLKSSHGAGDTVVECISLLGGDELSGERERISAARARLEELARSERMRISEGERIASAMTILIALGAVIILI